MSNSTAQLLAFPAHWTSFASTVPLNSTTATYAAVGIPIALVTIVVLNVLSQIVRSAVMFSLFF